MKTKLTILFAIVCSLAATSQTWTNYITTNGLVNNYVNAIAIDSLGNKWFGTNGGVSKFDGTNWTTYTSNHIGYGVNAIAIDSLGNIWFGGEGFGVLKFDGTNWTSYTTTNGLVNDYVWAIAIDAHGNKWFGTSLGVSKFDGKSWTSYMTDTCVDDNSILAISAIAIDAQGNMWFGTFGGDCGGVLKFDGTNWTTYTSYYGLVDDCVQAIAIDAQGNMWFGTCGGGVSKFDGTNWYTYTNNGLTDGVRAIAIDSLGNIWFGTGAGVTMFDGINWTTYTTTNGLVNDYVNAIAIDAQGNKWFGTDLGVSEFETTLNISKTTLKLTDTANSTATFEINSNISWTINNNQTWLTISSTSGSNNDTITVTASANSSDSVRTAIVTISGNGVASKTLMVMQATEAPAALSVSTDSLNVAATKNSKASFKITSNIIWNVSSDQSWIKVNSLLGANNNTITVTASANPSENQRTATVTVSGNGVTSKTVTITQAASVTGITEILSPDIQLYPVPVINKMVISFSKPLSQTSINIYTLNGIKVYSSYIKNSITEVDMSKYASGIYFVKIINPDGVTNKKIIKQ